jgi:hypothetical protein
MNQTLAVNRSRRRFSVSLTVANRTMSTAISQLFIACAVDVEL